MAASVQSLFASKAERGVPYRTNAWLAASSLSAVLLQFVFVPVYWLPQAPMRACLVVFLLSLLTPVSRALLHEAIHGRLVKPGSRNDKVGRALAISSGIAFDAIRFGHLVHHRFPRHALDRADVIQPGTNRVLAIVKFYGGLLGGIYFREVLWGAILLLPRRLIEFMTDRALRNDETATVLRNAVRRNLARRLGRCRTDLGCVVMLYGVSFYLYGRWWPILAIGVAMRALIISLQDNVAHYGTPAKIGAQANNSHTPRYLGFLILNQNLHGVHHDRPDVPWNQLPQTFEASGDCHTGSYLSFLIRQFEGPRELCALRPNSDAA